MSGLGFTFKAAFEQLKAKGFYQEESKGFVDKFTFELPKELVAVNMLYPKAFAAYFPLWLEEEFKKRTVEEFAIVGKIQWEATVDSFLYGNEIKYTISGKVRIGKEEERAASA
jgi:hypothetical protein